MAVPYIFATATTTLPLSQLDANFAYFANAMTVSGYDITYTGKQTINSNPGTGGLQFQVTRSGISDGVLIYASDAYAPNASAATMKMGYLSITGRTINATGTINTSGSDYAEYMVKGGDFTIAKGDVCGIDLNGYLTKQFSHAVAFVVKTTSPAFVGGDTWASNLPEDQIEAARANVDRIAFCGQVPVNFQGATPGDFLIPVAGEDDSITVTAVASPTISQYRICIGKVIAIEEDGRARIIVKVS